MIEPQDAQIEALIRRHMISELDRHVGKASRRFAAHIAADERTAAARMRIAPSPKSANTPRFGSFWSIGLVGAALAATLTIVSMRDTTVMPSIRGGSLNAGPDVVPVVAGRADIDWRSDDKGLIRLPDGSLARKFVNRRTDTITWTDPRTRKQIEYQQPREETLLVGLKQH